MENSTPAAGVIGGRREPSTDPVKAQGILTSVNRKTRDAARQWQDRWGFYSRIRELQEEEAQKIGMSITEYRAAVRSVSCKPEPKKCPVDVDPSPSPLPLTSSGMVGRRARCPLERYGPLVSTDRHYPTRPPLKPGQIYDPYKQTLIFLGNREPQITFKEPQVVPLVFLHYAILYCYPQTIWPIPSTHNASVDGDPISYKLPPSRCEVTDEMWARPQQLTTMPLSWENIEKA